MAKLLNVQIISTEKAFGKGTTDDPSRILEQYWSPDGVVLLEYDGFKHETWGAFNMLEYLRKLAE